MRASKGYLFRACHNKGVGPISCIWQRQAKKQKAFTVGRRKRGFQVLWTKSLCFPPQPTPYPHPDSNVEISAPNVMVIGGRVFGRELDLEDGVLMKENS